MHDAIPCRSRRGVQPIRRGDHTEGAVKFGQVLHRGAEAAGRLAGGGEHVLAFESFHHEPAGAGIEHFGSGIAVRANVTHHLGLADEGTTIARSAQHATGAVFEDLRVASLGQLRSLRLHAGTLSATFQASSMTIVRPTVRRFAMASIAAGISSKSTT